MSANILCFGSKLLTDAYSVFFFLSSSLGLIKFKLIHPEAVRVIIRLHDLMVSTGLHFGWKIINNIICRLSAVVILIVRTA